MNARPENAPTPPSVPEPTPPSVPESTPSPVPEPTPSSVPEPTPPSVPDCPTFAPRPGQTADCPPTLRSGHDEEITCLRTDVEAAVPVAETDPTEERPWHTVRCPHRKMKNNKITGTLLPGNGSLIGVDRNVDFYLGGCATQTSVSDVVSHISDQSNMDTKCKELQCNIN